MGEVSELLSTLCVQDRWVPPVRKVVLHVSAHEGKVWPGARSVWLSPCKCKICPGWPENSPAPDGRGARK